jgi:predicted deacetylase
MNAKYIIRLDDACPTMDKDKWDRIEKILDNYNVKPVVAVIPNSQDKTFDNDEYDLSFWEKVTKWQQKGWDIAMHGYNHVYTIQCGGLVYPIKKNSEFAGVSFEKQEEKIKYGISIFREKGIETKIFVAPSHTFDLNTLRALKLHTNIRIISDGIAFQPFKQYGFHWVPQQEWKFREHKFGIWTICVHPHSMSKKSIKSIDHFINKNRKNIIKISDITHYNEHLRIIDKLYRFLFWKKNLLIKMIEKNFTK